MTLVATKILTPLSFAVSIAGTPRFNYPAGVFEMHPALSACLITEGHASAMATTAADKQALADHEPLKVFPPSSVLEQLDTDTIGGVEHKWLWAHAHLSGTVDMQTGEIRWVPTADADTAVATGGAKILRWPMKNEIGTHYTGPKAITV